MALFSSFGEVNLDALDKSIADTAVDIFVYDTRKDSDGGKWRKRTKKTSWYNETLNTTTRGSRREFPAVAVFVLEIGNDGDTALTIYDGDDPDLPMWMVFISNSGSYLQATCNAVYALNGEIVVGRSGAVRKWNYIDECAFSITISNTSKNNGNLSQRNSQSGWYPVSTNTIVGTPINDVAMTVLPNAPIDPATGLPTPTIAVATNGGVSVIKDDGSVVDLTCSQSGYNNTLTVAFNENNDLIYDGFNGNANNDGKAIRIDEIPSADKVVTTIASQLQNSKRIFYYGDWYNNLTGTALGTSVSKGGKFIAPTNDSTDINFGESIGVSKVKLGNSNNNLDALVCGISSSYNTGWMHGDIKGAFLSDTDDADVTGTELITNGTFDTDTSGWAAGNGGSLSVSSGKLVITVGGDYSYAVQSVSLNPGTYVFAASMPGGSANGRVRIGKSAFATQYINGEIKDSGSYHNYTFTVVDQTTTVYFTLLCQSTTNGQFTEWDDISLRIAELDRSVNNKGLQVFGTITKSAVAPGAELVKYGNWSISNYLLQPYNSDLNFGTGDFYMMSWYRISSFSNHETIISREDREFDISILTNGEIRIYARYDSSTLNNTTTSSSVHSTGVWNHVAAVFTDGNTCRIYVNGNLVAGPSTHNYNITGSNSHNSQELFIGVRKESGIFIHPSERTEIALTRVGGSSPSAEQIKKIYEDEKVLFQENAKCTLYGSSDAVTALAYDDKTNLLHVGTSSGRSDFKGLRRINNTTTGITTAISASNRLIAEQ